MPTAGHDRDRVGAILDRIVAAADAPTALAEARRLFVELLDFAPATGILAGATRTEPRVARLASRGGVHVVASVLGAPGRVSATAAREVLSLARRELAGDALVVALSSDFAECHLIYPSQVAGREVLRRMVIRRGEAHRTVSDQLAGVYTDLQRLRDVRGALERAFDVEAVTAAFFREYRRVFELVEARIGGIDNVESLRLFAQTLFNRLLFIHFLDRKGFLRLGAERQYLGALRARSRQAGDANFYEQRLRPLFFDALSRGSHTSQFRTCPTPVRQLIRISAPSIPRVPHPTARQPRSFCTCCSPGSSLVRTWAATARSRRALGCHPS
jgi:hypothetical protein